MHVQAYRTWPNMHTLCSVPFAASRSGPFRNDVLIDCTALHMSTPSRQSRTQAIHRCTLTRPVVFSLSLTQATTHSTPPEPHLVSLSCRRRVSPSSAFEFILKSKREIWTSAVSSQAVFRMSLPYCPSLVQYKSMRATSSEIAARSNFGLIERAQITLMLCIQRFGQGGPSRGCC